MSEGRVPGQIHDGFLPGRHGIDAYGNGGFRFGQMSHRGSILLLPSGVRAWDVSAPSAIDGPSLSPVLAEAEAIELLLIGTGADIVFLPEALRQRLKAAGIGLDTMQTGAAAAQAADGLAARGSRIEEK